jgi:hypothetical protein
MNITDIKQRIENPDLCGPSDVRDFEELINKYPYAQSFPILLLKTLGQTKDIHFEDALNEHAYRISDRMHLYYLINDFSENLAEIPEPETASIEDQKNVGSETQNTTIEEEVINTLEPQEKVISEKEVAIDSNEEKIENQKISASKSDEAEIIRLDYEELLNEDIKFAKVEEMTFEPVRIHMEDDEIKPLVLKDEESKNENIPSSIDEEFFEAESVPEITIEEEIEAEGADLEVSAEELQQTNEQIETFSDSNQEEKETIETTQVAVELDEETAMQSSAIDEVELSLEKEIEEKEELSFDDLDEDLDDLDEDEELLENLSIESFDPTIELETAKTVEDLSILKPSSFEQLHKEISLDFVEKKFNTEEDELTSNAIAQGFHITLEEKKKNTSTVKEMGQETNSVSDSIDNFEKKNSNEKRSFFAWLHANEEPQTQEKTDRSTEIIEKFIQEEPKITRFIKEEEEVEKKKTPFFKATEVAKKSLKENVIPVSVTLAQIFESQGNFPKAIHSYEQLMLLYPEKKTFFANQIKKLKKKLNN